MSSSSPPQAPPHAPAGHPPIPERKVGVLIINLGTPDATDYKSMRRYLSEFLSDRRVVEVNPVLWQLILQGPILTFRPKKSAEAYRKVWNAERDESPLRTITRAQSEKLAAALADRPAVMVDWAMRYGTPSIADKLGAMQQAGCDRIALIALYPQYSAATTATAYDKAFEALKSMRWQPAVRTAPPYHDDPAYIAALANSLTAHLATLDWQPDVVLASYHGLPKDYFDKGDPYHCHCAKTTRLLNEHLGWPEGRLRMTFQSRFGPREWLQPYTDKTLEALPGEGAKKVAVIMPGFAADCVETLEEIAIEAAETFKAAGGTHFSAVPCLNDSDGGVALLKHLALRDLAGWVG